MSSSVQIDNKKKDILVLGKGPMQGLQHTLTAEKMCSINFALRRKKFCLSLHYNGANSYLFVNGTEIYKFKAKDSEILVGPICLGNISKDWSVGNMKRAGFTGYVYDFSVDYLASAVDGIKDIHKCLMEKNNIVLCLSIKKLIIRMYKMGTIKQINIKNRAYYFYNDIIELENFDSSLLKIDEKSYKDIGIYNIGYITIKKIGNCKSIYSVNPLYLCINQAS